MSVNGGSPRAQDQRLDRRTLMLYAKETENNSFTIAPTGGLAGTFEAIEKFFFIDASANYSTQFISPFGPQPGSIVTATDNRYVSQTYSVSPYIKGVLGSTNISYQVRDDNTWTLSSPFGDSTNQVPNTYANNLTATLTSPGYPSGWLVEYNRYMYDNGVADGGRVENNGRYTLQIARAILSHQFDPQLVLSARIGYEDNQFLVTSSAGLIYGAGFQWNPSPRTQSGGFWEHRFFGSSYDLQISHRLPNSAIRANFSRGLSSYPQLALAIPAGTTVTQFLDAAFTTRIPDPTERAAAIEQFLAKTGLPPTLAAPVNVYGTTITLQDAQNVSFVRAGSSQFHHLHDIQRQERGDLRHGGGAAACSSSSARTTPRPGWGWATATSSPARRTSARARATRARVRTIPHSATSPRTTAISALRWAHS